MSTSLQQREFTSLNRVQKNFTVHTSPVYISSHVVFMVCVTKYSLCQKYMHETRGIQGKASAKIYMHAHVIFRVLLNIPSAII